MSDDLRAAELEALSFTYTYAASPPCLYKTLGNAIVGNAGLKA